VAGDLAGNETRQEFDVTINLAPRVDPINDKLVFEGSQLTFTVSAVDNNSPLTFSLADGVPAGAAIDATSGQFSWTPTEAQGPGEYPITVHVTDATGALATETFQVEVAELNESPVLDAIEDRTVGEGQLIDFVVQANDPDLPDPGLVFSLEDPPEGAQIDPSTGRLTWRPNETQGGSDFTITVKVMDAAGVSDEQSFNVTVREVDTPPQFSALERQVVLQGSRWQADCNAHDPDLPANSVTYSLEEGAPDGVSIDPTTGIISWDVPDDYPAGNVTVNVRATEMVPQGQEARSSTLAIQVMVVDVQVLVFESLLAEQAAASTSGGESEQREDSSDGLQEALLFLLEEFAADGTLSSSSATRAAQGPSELSSSTPGEGAGVFGIQIGADTGLGRNIQPGEELTADRGEGDGETESKPDKVEESGSDEQAAPREERSGRRQPQATDAAVEAYLEDEQSA
jgi:hypothetical protein